MCRLSLTIFGDTRATKRSSSAWVTQNCTAAMLNSCSATRSTRIMPRSIISATKIRRNSWENMREVRDQVSQEVPELCIHREDAESERLSVQMVLWQIHAYRHGLPLSRDNGRSDAGSPEGYRVLPGPVKGAWKSGSPAVRLWDSSRHVSLQDDVEQPEKVVL